MIYHTKACNTASFKQVTNITREGDGLWEKCPKCKTDDQYGDSCEN